jgi:branched-chain amino acid transport system substrate-binding protein
MKALAHFSAFVLASVCLAGPGTAQEPVKIGATVALTGPGADLGNDQLRGMRLAIEDVNAKGGIRGRKLELVYRDDEGQPPKAKTFAKELVHNEQIVAFFPNTMTTPNLATMTETTAAGVPHIVAGTTSDVICPDSPTPKPCHPFVFRLSTLNSWQANKLAEYAVNTLKAKRVGLLYDSTEYGQDGRKRIAEKLAALGSKPVFEGTYDLGEKNFKPLLLQLQQSGADALIVWTIGPPAARITLEKRELGLDSIKMLAAEGIATADYRNLTKEASNGVLLAARMKPTVSDPDPLVRKFVDRYVSTYKTDPDIGVPAWAIGFYDAVVLFADTAAKVGFDRKAIRDEIERTTFKGVTGIIYRFGPDKHNGREPEAVVMNMIQDRKLVDPK